MAVFEKNPHSGRQFANVKDAIGSLNAFNALYAVSMADGNKTLCGNENDTAQWRKLVYDGVINCGGNPMELDFFEKIFGGKTESIEAKQIFFRYNSDIEMNVYAQDAASGAAGEGVWVTLAKGNHSGGGKLSFLSKGYSLYIYEDRQWVSVVDEDKSVDFGHRFLVRGNKKAYAINIRKGKKLMVMPTQMVGGLSGPTPSTAFQSVGYTNKLRPFRVRKDYEIAIDLMRGYEEVLQWAVTFDRNGQEVDAWELYVKSEARVAMKWAKNLIFYLGQSIDNPDLLGTDQGKVTVDYSGFEGYIPTMFYGGAQVIDYDPGIGFDLEADWEPAILRNDSLKLTNEFLVMHGLPFILALQRNANKKFKDSTNCTFETFKRMGSGAKPEDILQLGVKSYEYANFSLHFKQISALSDTRGIGNHNVPMTANFIPGNGLRDSKNREVPAIQFFMPRGVGATGMLEEFDRDLRKIDGWDKLAGHLAETVMMITHCPHQHIMANPEYY